MKKITSLLIILLALTYPLSPAFAKQAPLRVGIAQFADHPSLDNCREGLLLGLADAQYIDGDNIKVDYQNAQADMGLAAIIASTFVDNGYDLIIAIATPMAMTAVNTAFDKVPVVFTAVSAPVEAGLSNQDGLSPYEATGTSDLIPVADQLALIRAMQPQAKTIGLLYTVGEVNSQVQARQYREQAAAFGFDIVEATVTAGTEISLALPGLLSRVDCLSMLTDNTVVQYLDLVLDQANEKNLPVYGSEIEQVKKGCLATVGIDYVLLGQQTGHLAARVLSGEAANTIPFEVFRDFSAYYNQQTLQRLGLLLPKDYPGSLTDVAP